MNRKFTWALKIMRKVATGTTWICESSHPNCVFYILQELAAERKVSILRPDYLIRIDVGQIKSWNKLLLRMMHKICKYTTYVTTKKWETNYRFWTHPGERSPRENLWPNQFTVNWADGSELDKSAIIWDASFCLLASKEPFVRKNVTATPTATMPIPIAIHTSGFHGFWSTEIFVGSKGSGDEAASLDDPDAVHLILVPPSPWLYTPQ